MLTSITPLGERGRGSRWGVTVSFFILGSLLAGTASGALAGLAGALLLGGTAPSARLVLLAVALGIGLVVELGIGRWPLPSVRRQVNEDWLGAYRGWVYGLGFGLQLGAGAATIVITAGLYLGFVAALLSASVVAGAAIGATFGLLRGLAVLPAARVTDPGRLHALAAALRRWERPVARLNTGGIAAALLASLLILAVGGG